jgi:SAM-dependent methyltransferase
MISVAKKKAEKDGLKIDFINADFKSLKIARKNSEKFDAAIAMYWTLGPLLEDGEVVLTLSNVNSLLKKGGLFIFDVENADGIRREFLSKLYMDRQLKLPEGQVIRFNQSTLEMERVLDWTAVYLFQLNGKIDVDIDHLKLRFFHFSELKKLLTECGFEVLRVLGGPGKRFTKRSGSIFVVSRKV